MTEPIELVQYDKNDADKVSITYACGNCRTICNSREDATTHCDIAATINGDALAVLADLVEYYRVGNLGPAEILIRRDMKNTEYISPDTYPEVILSRAKRAMEGSQ